jgi:glucosyl-dolichyl phosphate glucuronosyltransferase
MMKEAEVASGLEVTNKAEVASGLEVTNDVSVIICAYTEERWSNLGAAVASIQQQSAAPREIIVVIDYNRPLFERARAELSGVLVIENSEPKGISGARNSGGAVAQGTLIAYLDDDAIAEPDWLELLCACCKDAQVLGVGGVVEPLWSVKRPVWFPKEFYWVVGCSYQHLPAQPLVVRNPYGGCFCIRRSVFEGIGGYRNGIGRVGADFMGCEETELCIRATQQWTNKVFLCEPRARIHHHIPARRSTWQYFRSRCYAEGLSKAAIASYVGTKDSLSSERTYLSHTLPLGILHGLRDAFRHSDMTGFSRIGALTFGVITTMLGYVVGRVSKKVAVRKKIDATSTELIFVHGKRNLLP